MRISSESFSSVKRSCTTALAAISPHPFSLLSHLAHGKRKLRVQPEVADQ